MIVSWKWLQDYLPLPMTPAEAAERLTFAGLNHEETHRFGDDFAIDLEVTSNRPDCLGHLGIAREISVLWDSPLTVPVAQPAETGPDVAGRVGVEIQCPDLCPQYTARLIEGVTIGPSPAWMAERLTAVGVNAINNVVDATNYVMLECGQPLHAFDFDHLTDGRIVVRRAALQESLQAIDHREYPLLANDCVIADARRAVALGGVMGGADSEVSDQTVNVLIEAAEFAPLAIRHTSRRLKLHSPSSYRFERGVDPAGVDWASRRCCELILKSAGGSFVRGVVVAGQVGLPPEPVVLRFAQLLRILGVAIGGDEARGILTALGCRELQSDSEQTRVAPPTWRRDLTREADLIEEVARIHGYDKIPEDVGVAMAPTTQRKEDRVLGIVRAALLGAGMDEAMTISLVADQWASFSPWTSAPPIRCQAAMIKGADILRTSLTPSLLHARRHNEAKSNAEIELFETARVYLPGKNDLPIEQWTLGLVSQRDFYAVKGLLEHVLRRLAPGLNLEASPTTLPDLDPVKCCRLSCEGRDLGFLGELSEPGREHWKLRGLTTVTELSLDALTQLANLQRISSPISDFPSIDQDLNFILPEAVRWSDLETTVKQAGGELLEQIHYRETYRDRQRDGEDHKRVLLSILLRSNQDTLTGEQAESVREQICNAVAKHHQGKLVG